MFISDFLLIDFSKMVPGTAWLIILHNKIPLPTFSKRFSDDGSIGRIDLRSS